MIYVSSACIEADTILEAVDELQANGFNNIELSGGTEYYDGVSDDLLELSGRAGLNLLVHNYFPPAKEPFVLNLASLDNSVFDRTVTHLSGAIELCKVLGAKSFGFHAGFYLDIALDEVGKSVGVRALVGKEKAVERFCSGYNSLKSVAGDGFDLYIENNVLSSSTAGAFNGNPPLMLLASEEYFELKRLIDFKLLLDIGHLKVSCRSLGLDFDKELGLLAIETDYLHVSDNDGFEDRNETIESRSVMLERLKGCGISHKTVTLEIYDGVDKLKRAYEMLKSLR